MSTRTKVPTGRGEAILFDSDMSCCVCQIRSKSVQLHHIDGNPSNHDSNNIAVLCLEHHSEATSTPGLGRRLSQGVIRRYRDEWLSKVRARRLPPKLATRAALHEALIQAIACHEIRKIRHSLQLHDWNRSRDLLQSLYMFTNWGYGTETRTEILYTLALMADSTRHKMPVAIAREIEGLAFAALPIASLVNKSRRRTDRRTQELLRSAMSIGFSIAHDGVKYLHDLAVTAAGSRLMFIVLRYAHLNNLREKKHILGEFARLQAEAVRMNFEDARRWIEFEKLDALALDGDPLPSFPRDLAATISAAS